jgi:small subunit ribosomal protein S12
MKLYKIRKKKNKIKSSRSGLLLGPQVRGIVERVETRKPKKPNSSQRKVCKIRNCKTGRRYIVYIPGEGHDLKVNNKILISGVGPRDLNGVNYSAIRGVLDLKGVKRGSSRSKYGSKKK